MLDRYLRATKSGHARIECAVLFRLARFRVLPPNWNQTVKPRPEGASRTPADADREHILKTLMQTDWLIVGQDGAVNRLGLPRTTLIY